MMRLLSLYDPNEIKLWNMRVNLLPTHELQHEMVHVNYEASPPNILAHWDQMRLEALLTIKKK